MKLKLLVAGLLLVVLTTLTWMFWPTESEGDYAEVDYALVYDSIPVAEVVESKMIFGYNVDSLIVQQGNIKRNQSLSEILLPYRVSHQSIFKLASNSKGVFDVRKIKEGRPYTLLISPDSSVSKLVYEPNRTEYVVFHLEDSIYAEQVARKIEVVQKSLSGVIDASLAVTVSELGESVELTNKFVDVFAWVIDFWRLQKGDHFKILYSEKQVDGVPIGIDQIESIYFNHSGNDYWAFSYDQGNGMDFFDENGNSLRKALLKYPLEFSRISSGYTLNRFHPVQKRWKAHRGTDFAAATGTPIRSVGDGIVTEAMFKKYNGNYVKIRHNATYTTQYLHMSKIASGITPGTRVRQGQLIGFVGSTGLSTGAHLCYRFWKNGQQVDALKVDLPPSDPIREEHLESFVKVKDEQQIRLTADFRTDL